jgi:hypothetical protein
MASTTRSCRLSGMYETADTIEYLLCFVVIFFDI